MRKTIITALAAVSLLAIMPSVASATNITGSIQFGGNPNNYYNSANGFVPAGYGNSGASFNVPVGAGVEFGFADGSNQDTADFTGNSLVLSDNVLSNATNWHQVFTADTAGFFNGASLGANTFTGLTWSVTNDTLTVDWGGTSSAGLRTANFSFTGGGAVPEPATWLTMIVGMGAIGVALRRARKLGAFATA